MIAPTSDFCELVFFFLAHVPRRGADNLRSISLAEEGAQWLSAAALARLDETAALLADAPGTALQWWPELFESLEHYDDTRDRALCELAPDDVAAPQVLARLRTDGRQGELVHAELSMLAPEFEARYTEVIAPAVASGVERVQPLLEALVQRLPEMKAESIELAYCLGDHGRVYDGRIVVGAPAPWNNLTPAQSVCWALHETLVKRADAPYMRAEWSALIGGGTIVEGTALATERMAWLGRLELAPLLDELVAAGVIDEATASAVVQSPQTLQDRETYGRLLGID